MLDKWDEYEKMWAEEWAENQWEKISLVLNLHVFTTQTKHFDWQTKTDKEIDNRLLVYAEDIEKGRWRDPGGRKGGSTNAGNFQLESLERYLQAVVVCRRQDEDNSAKSSFCTFAIQLDIFSKNYQAVCTINI